jgi:hypothetical protein
MAPAHQFEGGCGFDGFENLLCALLKEGVFINANRALEIEGFR